MGKRKSPRHIHEQEFNQIRLLLDAGLTVAMVSKAMKRSYSALKYVKTENIKTFEEYRAFRKRYAEKYFKKEPVKVVPEYKPYPETPQTATGEQINKRNVLELLESIDKNIKDLLELKRSAIEHAKQRGNSFSFFPRREEGATK